MCDLSAQNLFAVIIFRSPFYAELAYTVGCSHHFYTLLFMLFSSSMHDSTFLRCFLVV
jgi:hypothetical protein